MRVPQNPAVIFDKVELLDDASAGFPRGPLHTAPEVPVASGTKVEGEPNTYRLMLDSEKVDVYAVLAIRVTFHSSEKIEIDPKRTTVTTGEGRLAWAKLEDYPPGSGRDATQRDYGQVIFRARFTREEVRNQPFTVTVTGTREPGLWDIGSRKFRAVDSASIKIFINFQ